MAFDYTDAMSPDMQKMVELDGFDLDLTGFDCAGEIEHGDPPDCPFKPGCGLTVKDCPLRIQLAKVSRAPKLRQ
jgi:hypothetical protein